MVGCSYYNHIKYRYAMGKTFKRQRKSSNNTNTNNNNNNNNNNSNEDDVNNELSVRESNGSVQKRERASDKSKSTINRELQVVQIACDVNNLKAAMISLLAVLKEYNSNDKHSHSNGTSSTSTTTTTMIQQSCEKVLAMCQKRKQKNLTQKVLKAMKKANVQRTQVVARSAYFTFCVTNEYDMARKILIESYREIGFDNCVRGCSFSDSEHAQLEILYFVLKMMTIVNVSRSSEEEVEELEAVENNNNNNNSISKVCVEIRNKVVLPLNEDDNDDVDFYNNSNNNRNNITKDLFLVCCEDDGRRRPANRKPLKLFRPISANIFKTTILAPASVRQPYVNYIDLSKEIGPNIFALTGVLSKQECNSFIQSALACGLVKDDEDNAESMEYCEIVFYNSIVENIWERIREHMINNNNDDNNNNKFVPIGINPRFRIFKYDDKSVYRRHLDGAWPCGALDEETNEFIVDTNFMTTTTTTTSTTTTTTTNDNNTKKKKNNNAQTTTTTTRLTFLLYLNDDFEGGETTFFNASSSEEDDVDVNNDNTNNETTERRTIVGRSVSPRTGSVLCFPHGEALNSPVHEGSKVFPLSSQYHSMQIASACSDTYNYNLTTANCKFVIRTDVVFEQIIS